MFTRSRPLYYGPTEVLLEMNHHKTETEKMWRRFNPRKYVIYYLPIEYEKSALLKRQYTNMFHKSEKML